MNKLDTAKVHDNQPRLDNVAGRLRGKTNQASLNNRAERLKKMKVHPEHQRLKLTGKSKIQRQPGNSPAEILVFHNTNSKVKPSTEKEREKEILVTVINSNTKHP